MSQKKIRRKDRKQNSRTINDFFESRWTEDGYGCFEGIGPKVVKYSKLVSKNQRRQFNRDCKPPLALTQYLNELESGTEAEQGLADHLRERILKELYPGISRMFVSGEKMGRDLFNMKNGLPISKNTKISSEFWRIARH